MASEIKVPLDLVGAMQQAYLESANDGRHPMCSTTDCCTLGMAAALRVVLEDERVLGDFTGGDRIVSDKEWIRRTDCEEWPRDRASECVQAVLANRRARLLKPRTPEDRVTIEEVFVGGGRHEDRLYQDGVELKQADVLRYARLGLIAKLREQEAQS